MFLNPENDLNGAGYHIIQSRIAIGSGGIFGRGLTNGTQCYLNFLPEKYTDFIFSAIAEELGLFGCLVVITLYMILLLYNYSVAFKTKDKFLKYLAFGINAMIFFYMFINISMVCGIVPVVGIPLPFLSCGGAALSCLMVGEGIVVAIDNAQRS
jgi:rod shape determining protein RodA